MYPQKLKYNPVQKYNPTVSTDSLEFHNHPNEDDISSAMLPMPNLISLTSKAQERYKLWKVVFAFQSKA